MNYIIEILKNDESFDCGNGVEENTILNAETSLGIKFADSYRQYLTAFGLAMYEGHEFSGLLGDKRTNVVELTKEIREKNTNVPAEMYVIEQTYYDGIVILQNSKGNIYYLVNESGPCFLYDTLEEYLLRIFLQKNVLNNQL